MSVNNRVILPFREVFIFTKLTGIIPFSDCGYFVASLVAGVVSFMVEGRVGSVKG